MKLQMKTSLAEDAESVNVELMYDDELKNLIKKYSCTNLEPEKYTVSSEKRERFKIKRLIANSIYLDSCYCMLFDKDLLTNGKTVFKFSEAMPVYDIKKTISDKLKKVVSCISASENLNGTKTVVNVKVGK